METVVFIDAERGYRHGPGDSAAASAAELIVARAWPHHLARYRAPQGIAAGLVASARVEHGRWLVDCPVGCGGAQYASRTDRRFFCVDCLHSGTEAEDRWVRVEWPAVVSEIERVLSERPDPRNRNWRPGETVADLEAENQLAALARRAIAALDPLGQDRLAAVREGAALPEASLEP